MQAVLLNFGVSIDPDLRLPIPMPIFLDPFAAIRYTGYSLHRLTSTISKSGNRS